MEKNSTLGSNPVVGAYVPPKNWNDLNSDEKIERLREQVKNLSYSTGRAQSDIHHLRNNFKKHSHLEKDIVVPFNEYDNNNSLQGVASLSNPDYF